MSDLQELYTLIEKQDKKIDRILSWAEGDEKLGTPSVMQRINENSSEIRETRKRTYENEERINANTKDIKNLDKRTGAIGVGTGGLGAAAIEFIKSFFG